MISLTEKAVGKIKEIAEAEGIEHLTIRVAVKGGGCAGFEYDMEFNDRVSESDETFDIHGVKVVSDSLSIQYLDNVEIDYLESPLGGGFKFNNPDVKSTCGCGNSFNV
jgi:iron-sulfur cluster assembly accessory protein